MNTEDYVRTYEAMKTHRGGHWDNHWEEVARYCFPRQRGFTGSMTPGSKRTQYIYDSAAIIALERFAAVIDSILTPRQSTWHGLEAVHPELNKLRSVKIYTQTLTRLLFHYRYLATANFPGQNMERWMSMGAFGNGLLFIDEDKAGPIRYKNIHLKNVYFMLNHQGVIDTVYRVFEWTARQAAQKWGAENLPDEVRKCLEDPAKVDEKFEFLHCVHPREDYKPGNLDKTGKPWKSVYIIIKFREELSNDGYYSFPYSVSRYVTAPDEIYGRGPAMSVLADTKMLNEMSRGDIRAMHKLVDPPTLLSDDGVLRGGGRRIQMTPGGAIVGGLDHQGRELVKPYQTGARVDLNEQKMEQRRNTIGDAHLTTLFQILVENPRMSATEAMIRANEKAQLLTPTVGRQETETIHTQVERELDILARRGLLPPMPPELAEAGGEYKVVSTSPLSRMQRAEELVGIQHTVETLTPMMQIDPEVMDVFDPDRIAQVAAEVSGAPADVTRSPEQIAAIRDQRRREQQAAQMVEAAPELSGAIKDIAQAQNMGQGG